MYFKGKKIESHFSFYFTIICLKKKKNTQLIYNDPLLHVEFLYLWKSLIILYV